MMLLWNVRVTCWCVLPAMVGPFLAKKRIPMKPKEICSEMDRKNVPQEALLTACFCLLNTHGGEGFVHVHDTAPVTVQMLF